MEKASPIPNNQIIRMDLPRLGGARSSAEEFTKELPSDLNGWTVELNGKPMRVSSQGFASELCKQILEVRKASSLVLVDVPDNLVYYVRESARIRNCERVTVKNS